MTIAMVFHFSFQSLAEDKWWKGNLHTHTLWSDGDHYPDMVAKWYQDHGYHFLVLSDHNIFQDVERWTQPAKNKGGIKGYKEYKDTFGKDWVEERVAGDLLEVRLKTLSEIQGVLSNDKPFILIPGEEVTARYLTSPIHLNASNIKGLIKPLSGSSVLEVMQKNVDQVAELRRKFDQPILIHLNHPNFGWAVTAEELMKVRGENFFEVYNGHPSVRNIGDRNHASTERMWDIILAWRLEVLGMDPMYGLATDDSHNYYGRSRKASNTGRGWVWVKSESLEASNIIQSLEAGQFYSSTGVEIKELQWEKGKPLEVIPKSQNGETFKFVFIGTRKGFDKTNSKIRTASGEALRMTHRYSEEVGEILQESEGLTARYIPKGDELYVRCYIESSRKMTYPLHEGDKMRAWLQPVVISN